MECSSWDMIKLAKEKLEMLETQYPNRFDYLKQELESFISLHESKHFLPETNFPCSSSASAPATQASTSRKWKRKKENRVDSVLERAKLCLVKIQKLKSSFLH
ncbi:hypothetical protein HS088_TW04G01574 [Tripterygium wilfordii]|uniref:Uncharacterized protein n=1 Tax=Tripterygium wilfordii TaxID=458696 RepID=A0A7J7DTX4_TRIWF|nr:uncharacterized protein LOC119995903 [Tripterygium wilfordii]KAF5749604.1 hypothetical protein HS088_TW04G01574 [Tripterygium wilfordii]